MIFNMPKGLAVLFDIISTSNKILDTEDEVEVKLVGIRDLASDILDIFGINPRSGKSAVISEKDIEGLIKTRNEYKQQKKYKEADEIRKQLEIQGIILEDTKDGTTYRSKL